MDFKTIKGVMHYLFESEEEFHAHIPDNPPIVYWREGEEGDWVYTDDKHICQILKKSKLNANYSNSILVRTVCGTYNLKRKNEMLGEIPENIYSLSGKARKYGESEITSKKEKIFARYLAQGDKPITAFNKAFDKSSSEDYKKKRIAELLTSERVSKMVSKEIESALEEEGVSKSWLISRFKDIADLAERDGDKLRSLESLAKISGIYEHENAREQLTVWSGITPEQLEAIKKEPKMIAHGEREVIEGE